MIRGARLPIVSSGLIRPMQGRGALVNRLEGITAFEQMDRGRNTGLSGRPSECQWVWRVSVEKDKSLSSEYFIPDNEDGQADAVPGAALFPDTAYETGVAFEVHRARVLNAAATYSRYVRTLKILLPLSAFAIVAATMLFVLLYDADDTLTLSFTSVESVENDLRMVNPRFSGVDNEGRPFLVTATAAVQDVEDPRTVTLEALQADIALGETSWVSLSAEQGRLDSEAETLELEGDIAVFTDTGYEFHTERALVQLDDQRVTSEVHVHGQGPLGTLRADRFVADDAGRRVRFEGNVRMRIYPPGS